MYTRNHSHSQLQQNTHREIKLIHRHHQAQSQLKPPSDRIAMTAATTQLFRRTITATFILTLPAIMMMMMMMMQCSVVSATADDVGIVVKDTTVIICKKQKCENGCSALPVNQAPSLSHLLQNSFSLTTHTNETTLCVCPDACEHEIPRNCTIENNQVLPHNHEMKNPLDPCETFVCHNGKISIHMATCTAVHCPLDQRIKVPGMCCDQCDPSYSNFCDDDDNRDCDWHCRYGYQFDEIRQCDLCSCNKPQTTTTTTTTEEITTTTTTTTESDDEQQQTKTFFIFLDSENEILNILIICVILMAVIAFGVFLVFMIWFLHRRIYNRVPLISHSGSWKGNNQYA